ncbi:14985_t:CDS:1, partial [Dentiscutata heterogama]
YWENDSNTLCWCEKCLNKSEEKFLEYKENIEILECLVKDLDEELGIIKDDNSIEKLKYEQQIKVKELLDKNENLFAEELTQLGRTVEQK